MYVVLNRLYCALLIMMFLLHIACSSLKGCFSYFCIKPSLLSLYVCACVCKARGGGGTERSSLYGVRCTIPWSVLWVVALVMLQRGGREESEERGGVAPSPRAHRIHFSQRAGCWREGTRKRERERGKERREGGNGERERERASVCVRVSVCARGLHHRIPFTVSAGGHALMERIKLTTLSFSSDLSTAVSFQMWLTSRFMSPALSPVLFISERLWHHGFGYGTYK